MNGLDIYCAILVIVILGCTSFVILTEASDLVFVSRVHVE